MHRIGSHLASLKVLNDTPRQHKPLGVLPKPGGRCASAGGGRHSSCLVGDRARQRLPITPGRFVVFSASRDSSADRSRPKLPEPPALLAMTGRETELKKLKARAPGPRCSSPMGSERALLCAFVPLRRSGCLAVHLGGHRTRPRRAAPRGRCPPPPAAAKHPRPHRPPCRRWRSCGMSWPSVIWTPRE